MRALNDNNLTIEYEKVSQDAATISECAKNMNNILNNFNDRMKELKAKEVIVGRAADALEENFLNLRKNFDSYIKTVQDFSRMISYAANETKSMETRIQQNAENLPR